MPIEELARRGRDTLAFGPMRPVGLVDPRTGRRPHAVVQLRQDNRDATLYSLVGFQTKMTYPEQRRVLRMIPGLERAEFVRLGSLHRNTFIHSPSLLEPTMEFRRRSSLFFAGQLIGVEGYVESAASGLLAGVNAARRVERPPVRRAAADHGARLARGLRHGQRARRVPADERQLRPLPADRRQASRTGQASRARPPRERGSRAVDRRRGDPPAARRRRGAPRERCRESRAGDWPRRAAQPRSARRVLWRDSRRGRASVESLDELPRWLSRAADPAAGAANLEALLAGGWDPTPALGRAAGAHLRGEPGTGFGPAFGERCRRRVARASAGDRGGVALGARRRALRGGWVVRLAPTFRRCFGATSAVTSCASAVATFSGSLPSATPCASSRRWPRERAKSPSVTRARTWRETTETSLADDRLRFVVLGMGKLGGRELNFSSDVDLVYLFDGGQSQSSGGPRGALGGAAFATRMAELATRVLSEVSGEGFVFRVDLRLRPEGQNGPIVNSLAGGDRLLRVARPDVGARGHAEGAPGRRRSRPRLDVPRRDPPLRLPPLPRLHDRRGDRGDEGEGRQPPLPRASRPRRQARSRRHSRGRVHRPGAAARARRTRSTLAPVARRSKPCMRSPIWVCSSAARRARSRPRTSSYATSSTSCRSSTSARRSAFPPTPTRSDCSPAGLATTCARFPTPARPRMA